MSDLKINYYLRRGSTAALAGFSSPSPPTPAGGDPSHGYFQYDTTLQSFEGWDGAAWQKLNITTLAAPTDNAIVRFDGTTGKAIQNSLVTISDAGALGLPDDVTQVFNPGSTNAGLNVGSLAGDPSSADNGDIWYDSGTEKFRCRENGANADLRSGGGGGGSAKPFLVFKPSQNEAPTSNPATLGGLNSHPTLDFDQTNAEAAIFSSVLSNDYAAGGLTVTAYWTCAVNSGTVGWTVEVERLQDATTDLNSDSFASAQTITAETVPGTVGIIAYSSIAITDGADMDSLAAGEAFRIRIKRDVANDTAAGDARLVRITVRET